MEIERSGPMTEPLYVLKGQEEEVELAKENEKKHLVKYPSNQLRIKYCRNVK